jgi:hypothetical protein
VAELLSILQLPAFPHSESLGEDGEGPSYSSALSTLPPPVTILQQLPQHADLLK